MTDQQPSNAKLPDPSEMTEAVSKLAEQSQKLVNDFLSRQGGGAGGLSTGMGNPDPLNIGSAFLEMTAKLMGDPAKLLRAQMNLWKDYAELWQTATRRWLGEEVEPVATPDKGDRRFKDATWNDGQVFDFIKQSYLLSARWIQSVVRDVDGLDDKTAKKVDFYTRQFCDAMAPSNFVLTNPEVLRATMDSKGDNLLKGLQNLLSDLEAGKGKLKIKMTDMQAFKVGENVATAPGKVVFRTDLMELIQFSPTTEKVYKRPLLIVPPWINKFYILDLRPENSFIRWATDQGLTVFVVSWVNPDAKLAQKTFADYMVEGPLAALDAIEKATGVDEINIIGYCIGGTLTACTLSYMAAKNDQRIKSCTFFTALVDFADPGELGVFIDEAQLESLESKMNERGFLEGSEMATTFNMLRANDLIWSFVVNNYLLGKEPFPFDLLYWNSDSTRMPAAMHSFYLRKMYQENKLVEPGGIEICGVPMDLRRIKLPVYILSTREDHIAPWKSTYSGTQIYQGPTKFVLAGSGHIAGVINPPASGKYGYWTNDKLPKTPDDWLATAKQNEGSWWTDWGQWIAKQSGKKDVPARIPGKGGLKALEDAPGSYVKSKV